MTKCHFYVNSATIAKPRNYHMAAARPVPKRRLPCRDDGVGLQLRGQNIVVGNVDLTNCSVRSELGFDV
jgi:hypothetical protein